MVLGKWQARCVEQRREGVENDVMTRDGNIDVPEIGVVGREMSWERVENIGPQ